MLLLTYCCISLHVVIQFSFDVGICMIFGQQLDDQYKKELKKNYIVLDKGYNSFAVNFPGTPYWRSILVRKQKQLIIFIAILLLSFSLIYCIMFKLYPKMFPCLYLGEEAVELHFEQDNGREKAKNRIKKWFFGMFDGL